MPVAAALLSASVGAQGSALLAPGTSITPAMRAALEERARLVDEIVAAVENGPDGAALTVANIVWLRESLYRMPIERLRSLRGASSTFDATSASVVRALDGTAQIGSPSTELVYYPITPCRYIDTRASCPLCGPLNGTRSYNLALTGGAYGGSVACDPKQVVGGDEDLIGALAINVVIVGPTTPTGFIGARPAGDTATTSLVNWFEAGPTVQAANAGIVSTNQNPATTAEIEFFGSPTNFVVDVFGVFAAPTAGAPDCVQGTPSTPITANATTPNFTLTAACPAGYAKVSVKCAATAGDSNTGNLRLSEAGINNPNAVASCSGYYAGASSVTVTAQALCCRIPGR
jgi:hypothetical protein